ncbi:hypothetical protein [Deinococcus rubellus]|uniref:DUF2946 domain-containing protein n=2 Tax=Deinococcus rubellus TaxID=1889240 RepID=A0ABY5YE94_9DEIO|nr:hypothetical protein [Deinococcus rubellus]UWX63392.1 hypothetical protein N0D28_11635 [Deinococcus rubellus]
MNMPTMPGMFGMEATSPVGGGPGQPSPLAGPSQLVSMPMSGPVTAAPDKQGRTSPTESPSAQASREHHDANAPPAPGPRSDTHAGHCPFCFTAAFALAAFSVEVLARPPSRMADQGSDLPSVPHPLVGHKRARAPPFWS